MKHSVFWKVFGGYMLVIFVVASAMLVISLGTVRTSHINTLRSSLENQAVVLDELVRPRLVAGELDDVARRVQEIGERTGTRITIIDTAGVVIADSEEDPAAMENHSARPEVIEACRGGVGSAVRFSRTVQQEMLYVAIPVVHEGEIVAVMRVSLFLSHVNALLAGLGRGIILVEVGVVVLSLLLALVFARGFSRPVAELADAARRIGAGDFDVRVSLKERDEFGDLADSFNDMASRIKQLVADRSQQQEALDTIVNSIQAGLVVLNENGRIKLCNRSMVELVGAGELEGRYHWEVGRDFKLGDFVRNVGAESPTWSAEVEAGGRHFICSAGFIESSNETVIILHDITEIKRLAQMKKDLVVNVSHELRTPLTAIKGFVETMEETESEENRRYLKIVGRHTERLISIVGDLLVLSELEEKGLDPELKPVDIRGLIENVVRTFGKRFQDKGLDLELDVAAAQAPGKVRADPFKLDQVFVNLIENALRYTDQGGVRVSVGRQDDRVKVVVADTGVGIAAEHLPRIFERFYVADRARSRRLGGTGLGLSIVKHIVLLHGGTVEVKSDPGVGTRFTVFLPGVTA